MRALIKTAPGVGHLEVLETALPVPAPGEALVRVGPSGLCGTDLLLFDGVYRGRNRPVPSPLIVGHEASGEVVELGPGTAGPAPGTRVGIEAITGCGFCFHCLRGNYNLCQDWHHLGLTRPACWRIRVVPAACCCRCPMKSLEAPLSRTARDGCAYGGTVKRRPGRQPRSVGLATRVLASADAAATGVVPS